MILNGNLRVVTLARIGTVAYRLGLSQELSGVHSTFHVLNIKKCLSDETLVILVEEIQDDDKLQFVEEPMETMDWEINQLKQSRIPIVKNRLTCMFSLSERLKAASTIRVDRLVTILPIKEKIDLKINRLIIEYLVKDSKRRAFWILNEDILEITVLKTNTPYPSKKIRDLVQIFHDHTVKIPVHRVQVLESIQMDQGHRILAMSQQGAVMSERISDLERDNTRLRGLLDVASHRVSRLQHIELRIQREMRQIRRFLFYDRVRIGRLEACARKHLGYMSHPRTGPGQNTCPGA
ncbi:hypothetical protein Tco_0013342 [Tanacetum coccineum]